jgi:hypothetical protein
VLAISGSLGRGNPGADTVASIDGLAHTVAVIAADDDRVTVLGEARDDAEMATTAADHGYDSADLRSDVLVPLPRKSAVIYVASADNLRRKAEHQRVGRTPT